jgi:hypothetical protein
MPAFLGHLDSGYSNRESGVGSEVTAVNRPNQQAQDL